MDEYFSSALPGAFEKHIKKPDSRALMAVRRSVQEYEELFEADPDEAGAGLPPAFRRKPALALSGLQRQHHGP
jgi:hypothetical protein